MILSAWRGGWRETVELVERTEREAAARGEGIGVAISACARAVLFNGASTVGKNLSPVVTITDATILLSQTAIPTIP